MLEAAKPVATIAYTYGATLTTTLAAAPTVAKAAAASIFDPSHPSPVAYNASDPLVLFIVQAAIIISLSRILGYGLGKIRQPKVIAEVIAGLLVGPSVLGRVPHFTARIFPTQSLPLLNLVANIGLTLFLFIVGLEVDFSLFRKNARVAGTISFIGMVIPFALGALVSLGVYKNFVDDTKVKFGTFLLFIGTANAITAFPVLARILTELDLLRDHVGVTVLTAGVGNDVVGWILLALAIALTNASSGIIVLYVILTAIGWVLVLFFIVRPVLVMLCRRNGNLAGGEISEGMIAVVFLVVGTSAFITDRIGIHAIFGGFCAGLIIPSEIRHSLVVKIEDFISVLFLPLYFALSGLNTDLGLLRNGSIWGWVFCVIFTAFFSKFLACGGIAKLYGMDWRESGAVGSLMACKGLVELIVLNIGLNAGILNPEVFAMFVTMALVTTFATTPLAIMFYPTKYRLQKRALQTSEASSSTPASSADQEGLHKISRYAIILQQLDQLPALFAFTRLIKGPAQIELPESEKVEPQPAAMPEDQTSISTLRLIELTERTSALLRASESPDALLKADVLSTVFSGFTRGHGIPTGTAIEIVGSDSFANEVATHAQSTRADMIVLPWAIQKRLPEEGMVSMLPNPFERVFGKAPHREVASGYAGYVRRVFSEATCDVGLFLDRGLESNSASSAPVFSGRAHLFFAFHSGADDRSCLGYLVHLLSVNPFLTATVVRISAAAEPTADDRALFTDGEKLSRSTSGATFPDEATPFPHLTVHSGGGGTHSGPSGVDTMYPSVNGLQSETADHVTLAQFFSPSDSPRPAKIEAALGRITLSTLSTVQPLHLSISRARATAASLAPQGVPLILLAGRGRRGGAPSLTKELGEFLQGNLDAVKDSVAYSSEVRRALGDVGVAYLVSGVGASVLVLQGGSGGAVGV